MSVAIRTISSLNSVSPEAWDACAGSANPFVGHGFLMALEESGSTAPGSGWEACHLLAEDADGRLLGCAPLYAKGHSYGEYVFDWGWAEAYQRAGGRYYPKLQCAVPFTPATGPRLLSAEPGIRASLAQAMIGLAEQAQVSSAHITFPTEAEAAALAEQGWLPRLGLQYHWQNQGYGGFEDFLADLSSRKRKNIRKEREQAASLGLDLRTLRGAAIEPRHWRAFYGFYLDTIQRKWGQAYLTPDFFPALSRRLGDKVVLMVAEREGRVVAGALNLLGDDCLYGRNWGAEADFPGLHFELCYYRAIDFAIAHGLSRVEAGAQGEHKISRGYLPSLTHSAHWLREAPFRLAVSKFLEQERPQIRQTMASLAEESPYRSAPSKA